MKYLRTAATGVAILLASGMLYSGASAASRSVDALANANSVYDVWIRNGTVIDGTGRDRTAADVLITGDTIAFIGKSPGLPVRARRIVDATGKLVVPGFIDAHSHGDPMSDSFVNFLAQGITTVLLGQDGVTAGFGGATKEESLAQWMRQLEHHGSEVNVAALSGHGSLRMLAGVGDNPVPTPAQMAQMKAILTGDLAAGAFGLSFGLEYEPGRYAQLAEEKVLGDLVGNYGGVVMSHMRSEDSDKIRDALHELLRIDAHVHVSHIKIVAGHRPEEARAILEQMAAARSSAREVTADVYPYLASSSDFEFLYPDWAKRRKDYDLATRQRRAELEAHIRRRVEERNGPEAILFTSAPYAGLTLADLAKQRGEPYQKVMIDDLGYGGPPQAHFLMAAAVQDQFITADQICISTDGAPGANHPRAAASFVKILEDYVGAPPKMSFERAIYKMSGLAAHIVGITDRGVLAPGKKADILVLSPADLHSRASWLQPQLRPTGLEVILVNGEVAYEHGTPIAPLRGRVIKSSHERVR